MSKGFVTFTDIYFLPLVEVLAKSLLVFSKYPLHVFLINSDKKIDLPNVITSNISLPFGTYHQQLMYSKFYAATNNDFDYGCVFDADMIANINVDELIDISEVECKEFPIPALHGANIIDQELMKYLGVSRSSMPFCHATYIFSKESKTFLKECYKLSQEIIIKGFLQQDEILLNCLLWKYGANKHLNSYDPHYHVMEAYFAERDINNIWIEGRGEISFHVFHGCKSFGIAHEILRELQKQTNDSFSVSIFKNRKLKIYTYD